MGPRALVPATACITSLCVAYKIIFTGFDLVISTPTAKLPNLIPSQIFRLYGISFSIETHTHTHTLTQAQHGLCNTEPVLPVSLLPGTGHQ